MDASLRTCRAPALLLGLSLLAAALLTGCAAPQPVPPAAAATVADGATAPARPQPADSEQPETGAAPVTIDTSCRTDADCTVKNVGNCCGYYPACVNIDSPTDPEGVRARCAKEGRVSVCGFPVISACTCRQGGCEAESSGIVR